MPTSSFQFTTNKVINVEDERKDNPIDRRALLSWVNETLQTEFKRIDQLCTGAAYCQLWDIIMPGTLKMKDIKFVTNSESDFSYNFTQLQMVFRRNGVDKEVPVDRLVKGYFVDNLDFLNWFKHFFDVNYKGGEYDPVAKRQGSNMSHQQEAMESSSLFEQDYDDMPLNMSSAFS